MANRCPKRNHCGWMVGEHPTVDQGVVRRKACFHWSNNCCSFSANIRVRNCGSYYVYELLSNLNYHWKLKLYCGSGLADDTAENSGKHNCSLWNTSTVWRRQKIVVRLDKIRQPHYKLSWTFDFLLNSFRVIFKSPSSCFFTPQIIPDYLLLILREKNHIQ